MILSEPTVRSAVETLKFLGVPDRDVALYSTVTLKNPVLNMKARKLWLRLGYEAQENAREIWMLCARDPLFFINTFCIAAGTLVVTDRGAVPIEDVTRFDRVWDGEQWVNQGGPIHQGRKEVIRAYGIELTSDHKVMTTEGWKRADNDRFDRKAIRIPDGYSSQWGLARAGGVGVPVRLWEETHNVRLQPEKWRDSQLRVPEGGSCDARTGKRSHLCGLERHGSEMPQSER